MGAYTRRVLVIDGYLYSRVYGMTHTYLTVDEVEAACKELQLDTDTESDGECFNI